MLPRHLSPYLLASSKKYPVVAVVGPRQSGKTTLVKHLFPHHTYLSLENLDLREHAIEDPRGFLNDYGPKLILDEVQRVPELFSYLQEKVDTDSNSQYILTGSSQFLLMEKISQSLAGRISTYKLFPFSFLELLQYQPDQNFEDVYRICHSNREKFNQHQLYKMLLMGFYPRLFDRQLDIYEWYENYIITYVERDIRTLLQVRNIRTFENFLKLCAAQSGQLINYTSFANALGISVPTVKEWISLLETSGIIFILPPYFRNYSKRIVKTPKIYFIDTGILCHLLSIRNDIQLMTHPLLGNIFETFIISDAFKRFYNLGKTPPLYFWRDQQGEEIDLMLQDGQIGYPLEIKLSQTFHSDFKKPIEKWLDLKGNESSLGTVIYCGHNILHKKERVTAIPWYLL